MDCFITKKFVDLSDSELEQCSELYSANYGKYSGKDNPQKKGQPIKMPVQLYKKLYGKNKNLYISMCHDDNNKLLGHAIFLRKQIPSKGICSWVVQLVVHSSYRNRKIGSKLLQSAWGFSNYYAWGLATANAITLKTLESVTWREISVESIKSNLDVLEKLMDDIPFVEKESVRISNKKSQIFSNFYPELEKSNKSDSLKVYATRLGKIQPGYEWLAFTFNTQKMHWTKEKFDAFLEFSESQLKDAYSRMDMPAQPWTKGTKNEVDFILSQTGISPESKILDLGCGQGRHCLELAKRDFNEIIGIDFADQNVKRAREDAKKENLNCTFISGDARSFSAGKDFKYDCILCLYDVIGSFRNEADNKRILRNIKQHLAPSKHAVISVMNMELTESLAKHKVSIKELPEELLALPPSETMKSSGDIFNPDLYLIDSDENVVYRKEQFSDDGNILAEYVVADRRYTLKQITELVQSVGLKVREARYVRAGKWDEPLEATNLKAKEIVLVLEN